MLESVAHPAVKPPLSIATFAIPRLAGELLPRPPRIRPEESASTDLSDAARPEAYVSESESEPDHDDEGDARQPAADEVDDARAPATTATEESPVGTRRRPRQQDDPGSGADDSVVSRKQQTRQQTTKDVQQAFKYLRRSGPMGLKIVARSRRPPTLHLSGLYAGMAYPRPAVRSVLPLPVGPGVDLLHDVVPFRLPFAMAHERLAELELDQARRLAPPSTLAPPPFILIRKSVGLRGQTFIDDDVYVCDCVDVCDEYCQNRMTWHECNPDECRAVQCNNQALQRQECAQISLQHMGDKGWGIRLDQDVRQGDLIVEYVGELVDKVESTRRLNVDYAGESNFYILAISSDLYIDATRQGNLSRFTNHSCEPTCETQLWMVRGQPRLGIFALRDLPAGAEVTFDYKFSRYSDVDVQCLCGSGNCRGFLGATAPPKRPRTNGKKPEPDGPLTDKDILEMARNDVAASKLLSTVREANQGADQRVVLLRSLARGRRAFLRRLTRPPSSVDGC
ncbi:hypothetical protein PBRA_009338 [Plasmodiophora brassicae]|uniref:Histone-lysine N-methyltransferase n=1 Tax=Plasmodiophora brassicae TaxID=37360 RepID=A0A0G4J6E8_PLABS|nr:hypothetical protein PBRA_009338 [Plasmodiophora brassicae]